MLERGAGHIVNVSSVAGRTARAGVGVYNATKWGVNAFSEALRQEVTAQGIRVTIVEPASSPPSCRATTARDPGAAQAGHRRAAGRRGHAEAILYALTAPPRVSVNEVLVRPTQQVR